MPHAGGRHAEDAGISIATLAMPRASDVGGAPALKLSKRLQGTKGGCGAFRFQISFDLLFNSQNYLLKEIFNDYNLRYNNAPENGKKHK